MPLTLTNPETGRLAQALAALTGQTVEQAIERALREVLAREQERRRAAMPNADRPERGQAADDARLLQDVHVIARRFQGHAGRPFTSLDHAELLYDEAGLPR